MDEVPLRMTEPEPKFVSHNSGLRTIPSPCLEIEPRFSLELQELAASPFFLEVPESPQSRRLSRHLSA
jgi:hypothetical protein